MNSYTERKLYQDKRMTGNVRKIFSVIVICFFSSLVALSMMFYIQSNYSSRTPTFFGHILYSALCRLNLPNDHIYVLEYFSVIQIVLCGLTFAAAFLTGMYAYRVKFDLYKYRYYVALLVFSIYVILKVNGTSLSFWSIALGENINLPFLGRYRTIRSDEYAVWSAYAIAQGYEGYPAWSSLLATLNEGDISTLWESIGGIPAFNIAVPFKPLYWGFLIFGTERGFSWLWGGRFILLFLVSFDFAMYYTKGDKRMSVCSAFMLSFAPTVQWFYSQSICEVLIFAQLILISYVRFLFTNSKKYKWLNAIVLAWSIPCYIMVGFPAWLISVGYVVAALIVAISLENKKLIEKKNLPIIITPVVVSVLSLLIIVLSDMDTLLAVKNSLYPGTRVITGGNLTDPSNSASYRYGIFSLFLPLYENLNQSEIAGVISFAPTGLVLAFANQIEKRKIDSISAACVAVEMLFVLFLLFGFPEWLAKITFLSQCNRLVLAIGFSDTVLLLRNISLFEGIGMKAGIAAAIICSAIQILVPTLSYSFPTAYLIVATLIVLMVNCLIFIPKVNSKNDLLFSIACTMVCAGLFINPIQIGTDCVTELNFVKTIKHIDTDDDSLFLLEGKSPYNNLMLLSGKKCVSTTQVYPNVSRWADLDPNGEYSNVYNRFGHINVEIVDEKSYIALEDNAIGVHLAYGDLAALGVDYIVTKKNYGENTDIQGVRLDYIDSADGYNIYRVYC